MFCVWLSMKIPTKISIICIIFRMSMIVACGISLIIQLLTSCHQATKLTFIIKLFCFMLRAQTQRPSVLMCDIDPWLCVFFVISRGIFPFPFMLSTIQSQTFSKTIIKMTFADTFHINYSNSSLYLKFKLYSIPHLFTSCY